MHRGFGNLVEAAIVAVLILSFGSQASSSVEDRDQLATDYECGILLSRGKCSQFGGSISSLAQQSPSPRSGSLFDSLDHDLGKNVGLCRGHEVPSSVVQSVIQAADQGNRDSLYFLGLLKLYGITVSPDAAKAREYIRKAAEQRHLDAMVALGIMLFHGQGGSRDYRVATAWFKQAAGEGHTEAMWLLGRMYYEGKGVDAVHFGTAIKVNQTAFAENMVAQYGIETTSNIPSSPGVDLGPRKEGEPGGNDEVPLYRSLWFHRAATKGSGRGKYYLGVAHEYGLGVPKDQRRAAEWHSQAAAQGLADSDYHLGLMKAQGRGFSQDLAGAAIHFQKGAQRHHAPSMLYLGKMCLYGQEFPIDYDMALVWFERAADEGAPPFSTEALKARDELRASLLEAKRVNDQMLANYDYGVDA